MRELIRRTELATLYATATAILLSLVHITLSAVYGNPWLFSPIGEGVRFVIISLAAICIVLGIITGVLGFISYIGTKNYVRACLIGILWFTFVAILQPYRGVFFDTFTNLFQGDLILGAVTFTAWYTLLPFLIAAVALLPLRSQTGRLA